MINYKIALERIASPRFEDFYALKKTNNSAPIGWIHRDHVEIIAPFHQVFTIDQSSDTITLAEPFLSRSSESRSAEIAEISAMLYEAGHLNEWRGELYGVYETSLRENDLLFVIERSAAPFFGVRTYGAHINGFTTFENEENPLRCWIGQRSTKKRIAPLKFDQIAAGGLTYGESVDESAEREAMEEASIPHHLAVTMRYQGLLHNMEEVDRTIRQETLFCYDLKLPQDFIPKVNDEEMLQFKCLPLDSIATLIEEHQFKDNSALVMLQFMLRHGSIPKTHPHYELLSQRLISDA